MPPERVKYAVIDGTEVIVGASYDLDARIMVIMVLTVRRRASAPLRDLTPPCHYTRPPEAILCLACPKSVSSKR